MVCELSSLDYQYDLDEKVLILVLMEYGLRGAWRGYGLTNGGAVLILVLMEYGLRVLLPNQHLGTWSQS